MRNIIHIRSIHDIHQMLGYEKPRHPMITIIDLSKVSVPISDTKVRVASDLYSVNFKNKPHGQLMYGRSVIDFEEGCLYGTSPQQVIEFVQEKGVTTMEGWVLYFHPDLIKGYALHEKITDYGFFSYDANEALHLSDKEKNTLNGVIHQIQEEYEANIDEFSQDVLVSNIELLLSYIKRYYSRQFITRKSQNTGFLADFERMLKAYLVVDHIQEQGLPTVHYFAEKLNLSASYLSDLLKKETGKNTQEHIHYHLIEKAKHLLLNSQASVSEISHNLGFEYPQYFSRVFKKKTGLSPSEFRTSLN